MDRGGGRLNRVAVLPSDAAAQLNEKVLVFKFFYRHRTKNKLFHTVFSCEILKHFIGIIKKHMLYPNAEPNPAHYALARLESEKKLKAVIRKYLLIAGAGFVIAAPLAYWIMLM